MLSVIVLGIKFKDALYNDTTTEYYYTEYYYSE
jgi:hypothetical protein